MKRNLPITSRLAVGAIDELNACNIVTYAEYEKGIDEIAEKMKRDIITSESVYDKSKKTFYVSNSGDDSNDGLSPETAWKTLDKINDPESVCENCNILFERGGLWRGVIRVPHSGITYSAYGVGMKPRFYGSRRNFAHPSLWQKSEYENVWYTTECTKNVGMIAINHSDVIGKYDEIMCYRHVVGLDGYEGPWQLNKEFDFYGHLDEAITYLYCDKGNPGEVYDSIELGEFYTLVAPTPNAKKDLVFDNLYIKFVGAHGIAGLGGRENVTVQNCLFCYLGGSILDGHLGKRVSGFGNAVEVYGSCDGYYVNGNWIYQIYDTAITHQCSSGPRDCHMNDVEYVGNLCELCHWSIEYYNNPSGGGHRTVSNVNVHHNVVRRGGYGWGSRGREKGAALFNSFTLTPETTNFVNNTNIYDRCAGGIIRFIEGGDRKIINVNNTYIQKRDGFLGQAYGDWHTFDDAASKILEVCREENARFFYEEE